MCFVLVQNRFHVYVFLFQIAQEPGGVPSKDHSAGGAYNRDPENITWMQECTEKVGQQPCHQSHGRGPVDQHPNGRQRRLIWTEKWVDFEYGGFLFDRHRVRLYFRVHDT